MNLSEISGAFGQGELSPLADVDISPFIGKPAGSVVLQWREPSAAGIYQIGKDAAEIKMKHKLHWPVQLCMDVATLAACHVGPVDPALPPGMFYMARAADESERGKKCWQYLLLMLNTHYPHLKGVRFANADGSQNDEALKNYLCGSFPSAPSGQEDATRLSSDTSPEA